MSATRFAPGQFVFAKMRGYPPWPAWIESIKPNDKKAKYSVYFYGTHQLGHCSENELYPYLEYKHKFGKPKKYKGFKDALNEIEKDLAEYTPLKGTSDVDSEKADSKKAEKCSNYDLSQNSIAFLNNKFGDDPDKAEPLETELKLLSIELSLYQSINYEIPDTQTCIRLLYELCEIEIKPLFLKKNPRFLDTLLLLQNYSANFNGLNMSEEETKHLMNSLQSIKGLVKSIFFRFKSVFNIAPDKTFNEVFLKELELFKQCTKDMNSFELFCLVSDPTRKVAKPIGSS